VGEGKQVQSGSAQCIKTFLGETSRKGNIERMTEKLTSIDANFNSSIKKNIFID